MKNTVRLGEALIEAGLIDNFQLQSALGNQRSWGGRLGKSLIDLGFIDEGTLIKFLSEKLKFPAIDLSRSRVSPRAFEALPKPVAEKYTVAPVLIKDTPGKKTLVLAMAEPTDLKAIDEIEFVTNLKIEPVVALESAIKRVLQNYGGEDAREITDPGGITVEDEGSTRMEIIQGDMDLMDEVRKAQGSATAVFDAHAMMPETNVGLRELTPASHGSPTLEEADGNFNFSAPPLESFETEVVEAADETPLEMVAEEVAEDYEEGEIIEEIAGTDLEAEPVNEAPATLPDPYEYDVTDEPVVAEPVGETQQIEAEEEAPVSVIGSIDELHAFATPDTADITQPVDAEEPVEAVDAVDAEDVVETVEEFEAVEATEAVEAIESAEAEEGIEAAEAVEAIEAEEEIEAVEAVEAAETEEEIEAAEPIEETEPVEAEEVSEAEEIDTAETQPIGDVQSAEIVEATQVDELASLRKDFTRLAGKIEGLVSLFILREEGKLSIEEFIEELRKL